MKDWLDENILDCTILHVDNKPISYMVGVKSNDAYFAFDTAYHKEFHKYSHGMLMHNLLLENLYESGVNRFDFGYIADYKKRWTEQLDTMVDITVYPRNLTGTLLKTANKLKEKLKWRSK